MTAVQWLALSAVASVVFWVPYVLDRLRVLGTKDALRNPSPESLAKHSAWAQRARAADLNSAVNLAIFTALLFSAHVTGIINDPQVVLAAQIYFWARVVYYIVYTAGIPGVRTLVFSVSVAAQLMVAIAVLSA